MAADWPHDWQLAANLAPEFTGSKFREKQRHLKCSHQQPSGRQEASQRQQQQVRETTHRTRIQFNVTPPNTKLKPRRSRRGEKVEERRRRRQQPAASASFLVTMKKMKHNSVGFLLVFISLLAAAGDTQQQQHQLQLQSAASNSPEQFFASRRLAADATPPDASAQLEPLESIDEQLVRLQKDQQQQQQQQFANRQGQLQSAGDQQAASPRVATRNARQQQQQQQQLTRPQSVRPRPPTQDLGVAGGFPQQRQQQQQQQQQPQTFQRIRAPSGGEQFPRPSNAVFQTQPGARVQQQQQQPATFIQPNGQLAPTLSAFDLSSLTNLANNQQNQNNQQFRQQQQQQPQPPFRRLPPQLLPGGEFGVVGQSPAQTELPFIRQVFRPATTTVASNGAELQAEQQPQLQPQQPRSRPTPPPLFVPPQQQQQQQSQRAPANLRPFEQPAGFLPVAPFARPQPLQDQQRPRPLVRQRPSQRPQVPQSGPRQTNDVIRLASSVIQTANEGLAAALGQQQQQQQPQSLPLPLPPTTTQSSGATSLATTPPTTTTTAAATTTSAAASASPQTTTSAASLTTTPAGRRAPPPPLRTSASILALTSAPTSSPSSFSPALPINAALAASGGGRRRIPVRANQPQARPQPPATTTTPAAAAAAATTTAGATSSSSSSSQSVRRPEIEEFYETVSNSFSPTLNSATIDGFGQSVPSRPAGSTGAPSGGDLYGSRLAAGEQQQQQSAAEAAPQQQQPPTPTDLSQGQPSQAAPVLVPVTYVTTLTYLTTVLHGTHTLETAHETIERSTQLATLNAQLMDQIEHQRPLVEPTATVALTSRVKGKGTTLVNLKSQVNAFNQELVDAIGPQVSTSVVAVAVTPTASVSLQSAEVAPPVDQKRRAQQLELSELADVHKNLVTKYVYHYTMRPVEPESGANQPAAIVATSVRSELVQGPSVDASELIAKLAQENGGDLQKLVRGGQSGNSFGLVVDASGMAQLQPAQDANQQQQQQQATRINLGSTVNSRLLTEVNLDVLTYVKFDGISNVLVEVKPTAVRQLTTQAAGSSSSGQRAPANQLDTSFNVHMTLGGAIEHLQSGQFQSAQQTPALDSASVQPSSTATTGDLLRSSTAEPAAGRSQQSAQLRSQLRSRVASSRFRSQNSLQTPRVSSLAVQPSGSSRGPATSSSSSSSGNNNNNNNNKLRLARPQLARTPAAAESVAPSVGLESQSTSVRPTKPRFVVVTRTGQFGIRASAISSLAAAEVSPPPSESASVAATPTSTRVVSSRFVRPNRFQRPNGSQLQVTRVAAEQPASSQQPASSSSSSSMQPAAESTPSTGTTLAAESTQQQSSSTTGQPETSSSSSEPSSSQEAASSASSSPPPPPTSPQPPAAGSEQPGSSQQPPTDTGAASVYVTYFTTTTHTLPFTMNSEIIYTTVEEVNSRVATEYLRDLSSHFIEPTASAKLAPPSATVLSAAGDIRPPAASDQQQQQPSIEPSFVISLNTRTYFTTFTYFTTYSLGQDSQSIKSSESTTSNIVTETITQPLAAAEPSATLASSERPQILMTPAPAVELDSSQPTLAVVAPTSVLDGPQLSSTTAPTESSSSTQTTFSPPAESSTSVGTTESTTSEQPPESKQTTSAPNGDLAARSEPMTGSTQLVSVTATTPPTQPTEVEPPVDRITRTKSLYTTLTHFITFYSGTKTQLSTIQEISPTVVTEYIDRTQFEQQQQQQQLSSSIPPVVVLPTPSVDASESMPPPTQMPTESTPQTTTASTTTTSTTAAATDSAVSTSAQPATSSDTDTQPPAVSSTVAPPAASESPREVAVDSSVQILRPNRMDPDNQQQQQQQQPPAAGITELEAKVLASSDSAGSQQQQQPNIIELSDLIAANSSQSNRVALAGNLGAAIKDIVQLLAGANQTNADASVGPPVSLPTQTSAATASSDSAESDTSGTPTSTQAPKSRNSTPRLFGQKQREQQLQGSLASPPVTPSSAESSAATVTSSSSSRQPTPELSSSPVGPTRQQQQQQQGAAATIFFGDDGADERKKQIKTVWPGAHSTVFVTSVEPSTRSLTLTTTKVYYTRDSPITITSSFATTIAPRTFVSTIMGTRTVVNQLNGPQTSVAPSQSQSQQPMQSSAIPPMSREQQRSRQDSQAASHRLSVQQKQQKQQQQQQQVQQRQLAKQQAAAAAAAAVANRQQQQPQPQGHSNGAHSMANINQCQPTCRLSQNEVCRFTPSSSEGAQGTFACACRPGFGWSVNAAGQRHCQEVQSYVILLRLLQVAEQQVSFKRELQQRNSPEFKQMARLVRDHIKRAYMSSELTRDRFVGVEVANFARSLSVSQQLSSQSAASPQPASGKQPVALNSSQLDPLNAGVIVNVTLQLTRPAGQQQQQSAAASSSESPNWNLVQLDESLLKEELTRKLNMRQAAALAAAAAAAHGESPQQQQPAASATASDQPAQSSPPPAASSPAPSESSEAAPELLPNPNALFLADVEQVHDLDECASPSLNDCHETAACINEPGSYRCDCREYPDLNPLSPGRQCANELKSCDFCNNRGDCLRVPSSSLQPAAAAHHQSSNSSSGAMFARTGGQSYSTICQCHRIYLGRRCEINGLLLATLLPIGAILLIISVCLVIYFCRRWRRRSALSKGFRNIGTFGPNIISGTLDRKAMLESASESSDTHQRAHHHHNHHLGHHLSHLRAGAGGALNGIYETHGGLVSDPSSSSNESSPRQMVRSQLADGGLLQAGAAPTGYHLMAAGGADGRQQQQAAGSQQQAGQQPSSLGPYCSSIPPQIVIPRARHNQVNYAVHRGQVYMW